MFKIRDIKIYRKFPKKFNMFKIRDIEIYRKFPKKIENHQKFLLQNDRLSRAGLQQEFTIMTIIYDCSRILAI